MRFLFSRSKVQARVLGLIALLLLNAPTPVYAGSKICGLLLGVKKMTAGWLHARVEQKNLYPSIGKVPQNRAGDTGLTEEENAFLKENIKNSRTILDYRRANRAKASEELGLTAEEVEKLSLYSSFDFRLMNPALRAARNENAPISPEIAHSIQVLKGALKKISNYHGTSYRGLRSKVQIVEPYLSVGAKINEPGFLSSDLRPELAYGFTRGQADDGKVGVFFTILGRTGKSIELFSGSTMEREILFSPATTFEVIQVDRSTVPYRVTLKEFRGS